MIWKIIKWCVVLCFCALTAVAAHSWVCWKLIPEVCSLRDDFRGTYEIGEPMYYYYMSPEYKKHNTEDDFFANDCRIIVKSPMLWFKTYDNKTKIITNSGVTYIEIDGKWYCDGVKRDK